MQGHSVVKISVRSLSFKFKEMKHSLDDKGPVCAIQTKPVKSVTLVFSLACYHQCHYLKAQTVQKMSTVPNSEIGELGWERE